ncbi:hypothetical protein QQS21_009304 [Conoideocrella luteorostrata]|uniref:Uncharacterized protein n=1 Tax=Conoideocrella luteorostrata TaxID=1105319 RepID=A0AAJ0FQE3_9HYPO|nr:hypothetical protein QQS21_009304 [Conoideocrella luteorostrata]
MAHDHAFIQPALAALGAGHWQFVARADNKSYLRTFIANQYSTAIKKLIPPVSMAMPGDIDPILTCCLLFVLLESMCGNHAEAFRHLKAGSDVIVDWSCKAASSRPSKWLVFIFHHLGTQATIFAERRLLPDLLPYLPRDKPTVRFNTIDDADDALGELDSILNHICWDLPACCCGVGRPDTSACAKCQRWKELQQLIMDWSTHYRLTKVQLSEEEYEDERGCMMYLDLLESIWLGIMKSDAFGRGRNLKCEEIAQVLDQIELILSQSAPQPVFTLSADVIPSIIHMYRCCPDVKLRRRAIALLRYQKRREIMFDSNQVSVFLENHLGQLSLDNPPELAIGPSHRHGSLFELRSPTLFLFQ